MEDGPGTTTERGLRERARERIAASVERLQKTTNPKWLMSGLVAAALVPQLLPLIGVSAGAAVLPVLLGPLASAGESLMSDFVKRFLERTRTKDADALQDELTAALATELQQGGDPAAFRAELAALVRAVGGIEAALSAATAEVRDDLAQRFAELSTRFAEFAFAMDEVLETLRVIVARQAEQLGLQREHLDLERDQAVKLNYLISIVEERRELARRATLVPTPDLAGADEPADVPCPYQGLASFQPEDADRFFGRERLTADLVTRLSERRLLAVVGPSGSGKSSVVRAGLIPSLATGEGTHQRTEWLLMTPGEHPLGELSRRVAVRLDRGPAELRHQLQDDPRALRTVLGRGADQRPDAGELVIVVDQFEETFTLCADEDERRAFVEALVTLVAASGGHAGARLVLAMRADLYGRCAAYPELVAAMQDSQVLVGPMTAAELADAIRKPAAAVGLEVEPELVELMVEDVRGEPGALPLLSHALVETWERRRGARLTVAGYLEAGGVRGAIAQTADAVYTGRLDPDQRALARDIFLRLAGPGEGAEATRRRVPRTSLIPDGDGADEVEPVLALLADARLITTGEDGVEVAHEALIREWPKLQGWLAEDRDSLRILRHLSAAAQSWEELGREPGELYRGARLEAVSQWLEEHERPLNELERRFVDASFEQRAHQERLRRRRTRRLQALAAVLALLVAVAGWAVLDARAKGRRVLAQRLSAQSLLANDVPVSLLLATEAHRIDPSAQSRFALMSALARAPFLVTTLPGHGAMVTDSALAADSSWLATAEYGGDVLLWRAADTSEPVRRLPVGAQGIARVSLTPDGGLAVVGSEAGSLSVWDTASGELRFRAEVGGGRAVGDIDIDPAGTTAAVGSVDGTVTFWDLATGRQAADPIALDGFSILSLAYSADGSMLATAAADLQRGSRVDLWDVATHEQVVDSYERPDAVASVVSWRPANAQVLVGFFDGTLVGLSTPQLQPYTIPQQLHAGTVTGIDFDRDGSLMVSGGADGAVVLYDPEQGITLSRFIAHRNELTTITLDKARDVLLTAGLDAQVHEWHLDDRTSLGQPLATGTPFQALEPWSGSQFVGLTASGNLEAWDVEDRSLAQPLIEGVADPTVASGIHVSPDGSTVAVGQTPRSGRTEITVWDLDSGEQLSTLRAGDDDWLWSWALDRDGSRVVTTDQRSGRVVLWDTRSGERVGELTGQDVPVRFARFSPDDTLVAGGADDGSVLLWDVETGELTSQLTGGHPGAIRFLAFDADGRRLATAGFDTRAVVWDLGSGEQIAQMSGNTNIVNGMNFSPDGALLVTGGQDRTIRVWDTATGEQLGAPLTGHVSAVRNVFFAKDGSAIVSAGYRDVPLVWDLDSATWLQQACRIAGRNLTAQEWDRYVGTGGRHATCEQWPLTDG